MCSDGLPEKAEYDVHGSTVKGGALFNARELGEKADGKWNFVRYSFPLPHVLRIQLVDDEPFEKVMNANDLRQAVEKRVDDPAIYTDSWCAFG